MNDVKKACKQHSVLNNEKKCPIYQYQSTSDYEMDKSKDKSHLESMLISHVGFYLRLIG